MNRLRVPSNLPSDLEALTRRSIGACLAVHRQLGPGLLESVYQRAVDYELEVQRIPYELEHAVPVRYRDRILCQQRLDVLVDGRLILEVKSVNRIAPIHVAQVISYLRVTGVRIGLLVNFNVPVLRQGIRRIVL